MSDNASILLRRKISAIVTILTIWAGGPAQAQDDAGQQVRLQDGRRLYLACTGQGAPTILFESGYAASSRAWVKVQPVLARSTRTCSYDRAGYGFSDPGPMPRDGRAVARDLDQALRRAHVKGPFILVGHSAGGLYLRLFADLRPRDIAGMVLADPSIEYQDRRFALQFGPSAQSLAPLRERAVRCLAAAQRGLLPSSDPALAACTGHPAGPLPASQLRPDIWRTQISELDTLWGPTSDEVAAGRPSYGDMPLVVLTADGTYAKAPVAAQPALADLWWRLHAEIAARSHQGSNRLVAKSSHMMMFDRPDAIIAAVHEIMGRKQPQSR